METFSTMDPGTFKSMLAYSQADANDFVSLNGNASKAAYASTLLIGGDNCRRNGSEIYVNYTGYNDVLYQKSLVPIYNYPPPILDFRINFAPYSPEYDFVINHAMSILV